MCRGLCGCPGMCSPLHGVPPPNPPTLTHPHTPPKHRPRPARRRRRLPRRRPSGARWRSSAPPSSSSSRCGRPAAGRRRWGWRLRGPAGHLLPLPLLLRRCTHCRPPLLPPFLPPIPPSTYRSPWPPPPPRARTPTSFGAQRAGTTRRQTWPTWGCRCGAGRGLAGGRGVVGQGGGGELHAAAAAAAACTRLSCSLRCADPPCLHPLHRPAAGGGQRRRGGRSHGGHLEPASQHAGCSTQHSRPARRCAAAATAPHHPPRSLLLARARRPSAPRRRKHPPRPPTRLGLASLHTLLATS